MASTTNVKVAVLGGVALLLCIWLISGTLSTAIGKTDEVQTSAVNTTTSLGSTSAAVAERAHCSVEVIRKITPETV